MLKYTFDNDDFDDISAVVSRWHLSKIRLRSVHSCPDLHVLPKLFNPMCLVRKFDSYNLKTVADEMFIMVFTIQIEKICTIHFSQSEVVLLSHASERRKIRNRLRTKNLFGSGKVNTVDCLIEWCFTPLSIALQSYHEDSSKCSCLSSISPVLDFGFEVSCQRTLPQKNHTGSSSARTQNPWVTNLTLYQRATQNP